MKISIIIATYNAQNHLSTCLDSIINSAKDDINNIEIVIIDGGSTDKTTLIINEYASYITYSLSEKDNGIYDAWNKGIKKSSGDWIMFLGSDDILEPCAIPKIISASNEVNSDCQYISAKVKLVDHKKNKIRVIGEKYNWNKFKNYMNVAHVASLHKRTLFSDIGYYDTDFKICGDYELLLRKGRKLNASFIDKIIVSMQIGGVSYQSKMSLIETKKAKIINNSVTPLIAELDYIVANLKLLIKKIIRYKS